MPGLLYYPHFEWSSWGTQFQTTKNPHNSFIRYWTLDNIHTLPASLRSCTDKTLALIKQTNKHTCNSCYSNYCSILWPIQQASQKNQTKVITVTKPFPVRRFKAPTLKKRCFWPLPLVEVETYLWSSKAGFDYFNFACYIYRPFPKTNILCMGS